MILNKLLARVWYGGGIPKNRNVTCNIGHLTPTGFIFS